MMEEIRTTKNTKDTKKRKRETSSAWKESTYNPADTIP